MPKPLADQIIERIAQADDLYHRLVLVVAPAGAGKTSALQEVKARTGAPICSVNLELSRRMLDLTERQRSLQAPRLLDEIVGQADSDPVLLDNLEILFDASLKLDPLRLLQGLSRNRTVVATWNGSIERNHITYAEPEHPEYRRYSVRDILFVSPDTES